MKRAEPKGQLVHFSLGIIPTLKAARCSRQEVRMRCLVVGFCIQDLDPPLQSEQTHSPKVIYSQVSLKLHSWIVLGSSDCLKWGKQTNGDWIMSIQRYEPENGAEKLNQAQTLHSRLGKSAPCSPPPLKVSTSASNHQALDLISCSNENSTS